ncbi:MAG: hypothetical protein LBB76_09625 [Azoarcus sp.]|nr:hypothetical protein [Azoarcus sp.]
MNALVNFWEDFVPSPLPENHFPEPVFTRIEEKLIRDVSVAMDVFCDATPGSMGNETAVLGLRQWAAVVATAKIAYAEMMKRGPMPEEEEPGLQ